MMRASKSRRSLQRTRQVMGVGEGASFVLLSLTLLVIISGNYLLLLFVLGVYRAMRWLTQRNPMWWAVFKSYMTEADMYDPMPHISDRDARPKSNLFLTDN